MWSVNANSGYYHWGVTIFKINKLGFKEIYKVPGVNDIPTDLQKQGWKFLRKY